MKILTVVGARPQFIKASVVSKTIAETNGMSEVVVHTGQHYDTNMSEVFFRQLGIQEPAYQLNIHATNHGEMTGRMIIEVEQLLLKEQPQLVLVYGDTNSTLAGALAASKLHIPIAHIEAGLRSFNMKMPEEVNRILTDQVSDFLFCPTKVAVENLENEGFVNKPVSVHLVGDVMQDSALLFAPFSKMPESQLQGADFILATLHRAENTDNPERLESIINTLNKAHRQVAPVIMPLHPRTRNALALAGLQLEVHWIDPVGYLEMLWLLKRAALVVTDSGGLQKEAFFFGKACVTMRDETEWSELVECGANILVGANSIALLGAVKESIGRTVTDEKQLYGGGTASRKIVEHLQQAACLYKLSTLQG